MFWLCNSSDLFSMDIKGVIRFHIYCSFNSSLDQPPTLRFWILCLWELFIWSTLWHFGTAYILFSTDLLINLWQLGFAFIVFGNCVFDLPQTFPFWIHCVRELFIWSSLVNCSFDLPLAIRFRIHCIWELFIRSIANISVLYTLYLGTVY